jgi:hypothetical protein
MEDRVKTNAVAIPMPIADSSFFDTPIKGHKPRNLERTRLLTKIVANSSVRYSPKCFPFYLSNN